MRSPGFSVPSTAAGPPAMISRITATSSWRCSCAPMPSSDSDIAWLKFSAVRGRLSSVLRISSGFLPASFRRSQSFLTDLRHSSSSSALLAAHGTFLRSYSKRSSVVKSGSCLSSLRA
ncbi:hypothetical protein G6F50_016433 [Rhizopus delemar]|uniref:Uncharacterized protein n=1 Tax=Rhizopus delemar TaxID=936053 RepID=A0A9P6XTP1_9FUNG|nr:hypothetical protein G6F50_016433 [Rhizopus delemar]